MPNSVNPNFNNASDFTPPLNYGDVGKITIANELPISTFAYNLLGSGEPKKSSQDELILKYTGNDPSWKLQPKFSPVIFKESDEKRYKTSSAYKELGYNPLVPREVTEAMYDYAQPMSESFSNTMVKMFATAKDAAYNYYASYGDEMKALANLDAAYLTNAERYKTQSANQLSLEDKYPDFKSDREVKWYDLFNVFHPSKMSDAVEEMAPSLGFTLGTAAAAAIENIGISLATFGTGEAVELPNSARKVFKAISQYENIKNLKTLLTKGNVLEGFSKARTALDLYRVAHGAGTEAYFQAYTAGEQYEKNAIQGYIERYGTEPNEEFIKNVKSNRRAIENKTILIETPFLMGSNLLQFGNLIAPGLTKTLTNSAENALIKMGLKSETKTIINKGFQSVVNDLTKATPFYLKPFKKVSGALMEGVEESYQAFTETSLADYYNQKDKGYNPSVISALGAGFDYITSNQGMKEFAGGFAGGGVFQIVGSAANRFAKPKLLLDENKQPIIKNGEQQYKYNLLNKIFGVGLEKINEEKEKAAKQKVADLLNSIDINKVFGPEGLSELFKDKVTALKMADLVKSGDLFNVKNLQSLQLARMLFNGLQTGKIDLQIEKIKQFANKSFEDHAEFFNLYKKDQSGKPTETWSEEEKSKFVKNFDDFAIGLDERSKSFESIYNKQVKNNQRLIQDSNEAVLRNFDNLNRTISRLKAKYNVDPTLSNHDFLSQANLSIVDATALEDAYKKLEGEKIRNLGIQEGIKMSVFAADQMIESAKQSKNALDKISKNNTIGLNVSLINEIYNKSDRDNLINSINKEISTTQEALKVLPEGDGLITSYKEKVDNFNSSKESLDKIHSILNKAFDEGTSYDHADLAELLYDFLHKHNRATSSRGNSAYFHDLFSEERSSNVNNLITFSKYQLQEQENLNLYNYINTLSLDELGNYNSKIISDFLEKIHESDKVAQAPEEHLNFEQKWDKITNDESLSQNEIFNKLRELLNQYNYEGPTETEEDFNNAFDSIMGKTKDEIKEDKKPEIIEEKPKDTITTKEEEEEEVIETKTEIIPEEEEVIDNQSIEEDNLTDPISFLTPNISAKKQTIDVSENEEVLSDKPYDEFLNKFISEQMSSKEMEDKEFHLFIESDTFDIEPLPEGVERGEVIVVRDFEGNLLKVKDVIDSSDIQSLTRFESVLDKPIIFSFNKRFFQNNNYQSRIFAYSKTMDVAPSVAIDHFNYQQSLNDKARELIKENPERRFEVKVISNTSGIIPTSSETTVKERFGEDFEFELNDKGQVIVNFEGAKFVAYAPTLLKSKLSGRINKVLNATYETKEDLNKALKFLDTFIYTNKQRYFAIGEENGVYSIEYVEIKKGKEVEKNKTSLATAQLRINISKEALKNGFTNEKGEVVSKEDYYEFIKPLLSTSNKIVKTAQGKLYTEPVNAYFAFKFLNTEELVAKPIENKYKAYDFQIDKAIQKAGNESLENYQEVINTINNALNAKAITNEEHSKLITKLQNYQESVTKKAPKPNLGTTSNTNLDTQKADIERRRQEELNNRNLAEQNTDGKWDIAADYLLTGGIGTVISTDYLLLGIAGVFEKATGLIDNIRNNYAKELAELNQVDIKNFVGTELYNRIVYDIKNILEKTYSNKEEVKSILDEILKHPTGSPNRIGNQISSRIDKLNEEENNRINAKYDAELKTIEEELVNVKPVYHHTNVKPEDFNFSSFQKGPKSISQFGDGLNASSDTTPFLVKRYGKAIIGEVNDKDFVKIDANKTEKELYNDLIARGYKFSSPASEYEGDEKANEQPAIIQLFQDFQKSNPEVKGVKVSNHKIAGKKVSDFYVIYDSKSFYGEGSLKNQINIKYNKPEVAATTTEVLPEGVSIDTLNLLDTFKNKSVLAPYTTIEQKLIFIAQRALSIDNNNESFGTNQEIAMDSTIQAFGESLVKASIEYYNLVNKKSQKPKKRLSSVLSGKQKDEIVVTNPTTEIKFKSGKNNIIFEKESGTFKKQLGAGKVILAPTIQILQDLLKISEEVIKIEIPTSEGYYTAFGLPTNDNAEYIFDTENKRIEEEIPKSIYLEETEEILNQFNNRNC